MKYIMIIVSLMFISFNLYSLDYGLISGFEVGYIFVEAHNIGGMETYRENDLSIKMIMGYRIENFRIIGTYTNTFEQIRIDFYNPLQDLFSINISYTIGNIEIGFDHRCTHPVSALEETRELFYNGGKRFLYIRWYREF